jgi:hypothetical protein
MKVTIRDLMTIQSLANAEFINTDRGALDPKEFTTACYLKAFDSHFSLGLALEFPKPVFCEPDEEG